MTIIRFHHEMYKNRTLFWLALPLLFVLTTIGCKHKPTMQEMGVVLDTLVADTTAVLSDSATQARCQISLQLLTFANKEYLSLNDSLLHADILSPDYLSLSGKHFSPREAVDSFVRRYVEDYREFYSGIYADEANAEAASISYKATATLEEGKDSILNYVAQISNSQGSVSTDYRVCLNLDLPTKRILRLEDVFVHGAEKGLADAITAKLQSQASVKSLEELRQAGFFVNSEPYATQNFILKDRTTTFVYVMGEIADRSKGEIEVEVKNADIKPLFKR